MILKQSEREPALVGILESEDDLQQLNHMVSVLNHDLVDSGFEQYQYEAVRRGKKLYIERVGA